MDSATIRPTVVAVRAFLTVAIDDRTDSIGGIENECVERVGTKSPDLVQKNVASASSWMLGRHQNRVTLTRGMPNVQFTDSRTCRESICVSFEPQTPRFAPRNPRNPRD